MATKPRMFVHDMKNMFGIILGYSNLLLDEMPADDPRRPDVDEIRKAGESALALLNTWSATTSGEEIT
jgi:signal transduction histidine kinase